VYTTNQRRLDDALHGDEREKYKGAYIEPFGKVVHPGLKEVHDRALATQLGRRRTAWPARCWRCHRGREARASPGCGPGPGIREHKAKTDALDSEIPLSSF